MIWIYIIKKKNSDIIFSYNIYFWYRYIIGYIYILIYDILVNLKIELE